MLAGAREDGNAIADVERALRMEHPEAVLISASRGWNLDSLLKAIERELAMVESRSPVTA